MLGDLEETDPDAEAAQRRLAAYALAEIDRITATCANPCDAAQSSGKSRPVCSPCSKTSEAGPR